MKERSPGDTQAPDQTNHRVFAVVYDRLARFGPAVRRVTDPLRQASAGQAYGHVLEVGVGSGLNFPYYQPTQVERVDAIDPDSAMLQIARRRLTQAQVPLTLTQTSVEALPWEDATFDSVVVTLVFCSVADPVRGFHEIRRVLKPTGSLFLVEHVRAKHPLAVHIQDALVPVTTRLAGNCHWNRDTLQTLLDAGFQVTEQRTLGGGIQPLLLVRATTP